ncbi:DUF262 domain-containing protein [Chitinophaga nivalis]|uniref:DUF262 domain-containing protein n=1 Tax=Chitinophaga nivalis TaxID=2991709 RepID=A0ABT3II45_9BACT|nr:DUF262 domain-containing protein [Chitinophaga nivalis]MCW3466671.1 DUF262 domain-containing protein [Chitinophaga nivalis]MCW3483638.1 DUF262 domain-containing protein [Chitinophaga nivalis]
MNTVLITRDLRELFRAIFIKNSLRAIRSVFQINNEQSHFLNYEPPYQRKYVWTEVKATYFIETILLHGEIPPIVIFVKGKNWEVIDGRQRCETIHRFIKNGFSLKPHGLDKLWNLAGKKFSQLDDKLKERILNTQLRLIFIAAAGEAHLHAGEEEMIKREIFKRYNQGIMPLKKEEVFKAQYIQDEINIYFKGQFEKNKELYHEVMDLFDHRSKNLETLMQHIRQTLVLHHIPMNKFISEREEVVNKYYDYLSYNTINDGGLENVCLVFKSFKEKCNYLTAIKTRLDKEGIPAKGVVYECLYWALSVCEMEGVKFQEINRETFKERLVNHIAKQILYYPVEKHSHVSQITKRYNLMATFFTSQLNASFVRYLKSDEAFLIAHKEKMDKYMEQRFTMAGEEEFFSKTLPTSCSVSDVLDRMKRKKFNLRPTYQRDEVMNVVKASSLIESMLLGIKLHPLYIYVKEDGVAEVIDGQQRLLAIIGFLGERYCNETGKMVASKKDGFSLNLNGGLLTDLHGSKFKALSEEEQLCIKNYDLEIIEMKEENNKGFVPEELFKRLNHKPFPIKEHTFEFWNAYVDNEIISSVKGVCQRNSWLYLRKDDKRMLNEELVTCLCYLHFMLKESAGMESLKNVLSLRRSPFSIVLKLKNKASVTQILEDFTSKAEFLLALNDFELDFVEKVKLLIASSNGKTTGAVSNRRLDTMLHTGTVRMSMNFYLLWVILKGIPIEFVKESRAAVQLKISKVFSMLKMSESVEKVEKAIQETWVPTNHSMKEVV